MKKGFTLIELLSVIVVLAIISVIAVPTLIGVVNKVKLQSLKDSAYGLIEASNLYYAQNGSNNYRFDINGLNVTSNDTDKLLSFKGNVKNGVSIIKPNGKTVICVTDGKNSAYKNYNESKVSLVSGKKCTIPDNSSVVYLDGEASMEDINVSELLDRINQLETRLDEYAKKGELSQVNNNLSSNITTNTTSINQLNSDLNAIKSHVGMIIHSTTLDTEAKVKAIYGGDSWSKIEGRFLLGQSSSYVINSTGGSANATLIKHTHTANHSHNIVDGSGRQYGTKDGSIPANIQGGYIWSLGTLGGGYMSQTAYAQWIALTTSEAGSSDGVGKNMPPYKTVYIWERTA